MTALPQKSGIYLVLDGERSVIYVGQSHNIYQRWNAGHHKLAQLLMEYGQDLSIYWVELPEWLLNRAENAVIEFYKPVLNLRMPPVV